MLHIQLPEAADTVLPVIVGIATTGRADILRDTLDHMAHRAESPDLVVVAGASELDFRGIDPAAYPFPVSCFVAPRGSCAQRNAIIDVVPDHSVVLFLDDDFLIGNRFISATRNLFARNPEIVMATGHVIADGILGPGLSHDDGARLLVNADPVMEPVSDVYNGYGCNLAIRAEVAQAADIRFDEALPRYGWLEDVDFSRRMARHGRLVRNPEMRGVHLGTKTGRSRGTLLGYSQIANPVYLARKGTLTRPRALRMMLRNIAANLARSVRPEPWVDRRGRLNGNLVALRDLVLGRLSPERILTL